MLRALIIVAVLAVCVPCRADVQGPVITKAGDVYHLTLPARLAAAIEKAVPGFEPEDLTSYDSDIQERYQFTSRQAPWAVVGDFDADGVEDVIVDGRAHGRGYELCVWGASASVDTLLVERRKWPRPFHAVLMYDAPGDQTTNFTDESLFIWADAYEVYYFGKAGSLKYWANGKWNSWQNSD